MIGTVLLIALGSAVGWWVWEKSHRKARPVWSGCGRRRRQTPRCAPRSRAARSRSQTNACSYFLPREHRDQEAASSPEARCGGAGSGSGAGRASPGGKCEPRFTSQLQVILWEVVIGSGEMISEELCDCTTLE